MRVGVCVGVWVGAGGERCVYACVQMWVRGGSVSAGEWYHLKRGMHRSDPKEQKDWQQMAAGVGQEALMCWKGW